MALFTPCPPPGGLAAVNAFTTRPGFGPHLLTIAQQNSLVINNSNPGFSVLLIPNNNTVAFDVGSSILFYVDLGFGTINLTPNAGVTVNGVANITAGQVLRLDKQALNIWEGFILPTPVM